MTNLDEWLYLTGDEDGGVSLCCRTCDTIAYYGDTNVYPEADLITVRTIADLLAAGEQHIATHQRAIREERE